MAKKEDKEKAGLLKRLILSVVVLAVVAYGGYFAYAKATGNANC